MATAISERVGGVPWASVERTLCDTGFGRLGTLLPPSECRATRDLYATAKHFRSRIDMARYRFGKGESGIPEKIGWR